MSARHYKQQLDIALAKLNAQTIAAREWKTVADNRLLLLTAVDASLNTQISLLLQVGAVFGIRPQDPDVPVADPHIHSADEMVSFILHKVAAASEFTAALTRESHEVQMKLSDVLGIALDAVAVDRPTCDLTVTDYTGATDDTSSPIESILEQIEGSRPSQLGTEQPREESDNTTDRNTQDTVSTIELSPFESAIMLFSKT